LLFISGIIILYKPSNPSNIPPKSDDTRYKSLLPSLLDQVRTDELKADGTKFDIGDIRPPGYMLNALEWASRRGNYDIAEWLATDPRTRTMVTRADSAPVAWACYTNRVELARMLIKHGADSRASTIVVFNYKPPMHMAGENGQLRAVRFLVEECGHDIVNTRNAHGQDLRASLHRQKPQWAKSPGCVAIDNYAKNMGVVGNIVRMNKTRMKEIKSTQQKSEKIIGALKQSQIADGKEKEEEPKERGKLMSQERIAEAQKMKASGTALFVEKRFEERATRYEESALFAVEKGISGNDIPEDVRPLYISCFGNAAMCYIKLKRWRDVILTYGMVLEIDSEQKSNIWALYRRGLAHLNLGMFQNAKADLMDAYRIDNANKDVRKALKQLKETSLNAKRK